jgi:hypothetical protein
MNIKAAVAEVRKNNPSAIWYAIEFIDGEPSYFEIWDKTFSDESITRIGAYDVIFDDLEY